MIEPTQITPAVTREAQLRAQAAIIELQRRGEWTGAVQAHTEYQRRPLDWIVEKLEIPRETLVWSLAGSEYENHQWDGDKDPLAQILEALANWEDCGVESATGTGKCARYDTLVPTNRGIFRLEDFHDPDPAPEQNKPLLGLMAVNRYGKPDHVAGVHYTGVQTTYNVRTQCGYEIGGSERHRVLAWRDNGVEWVHVHHLRPGDRVAIQRGSNLWSQEDQVDERTALLMGHLVGDGGLTLKGAVTYSSADRESVDLVVDLLRDHSEKPATVLEQGGKWTVRLCSMALKERLAGLGLGSERCEVKKVPDTIMRSSWPVVRAFLRGLFDTDGHADRRGGVEFCTVSTRLAKEVHFLLLNAGVVSRLRRKDTTWVYKGERKFSECWVIDITGADARRFYDHVGFGLERKQERRFHVPWSSNTNRDTVPATALFKGIRERVRVDYSERDSSQPMRWTSGFGQTVRSWAEGWREPSYDGIERYLTECSQFRHYEEHRALETVAADHYFFDRVAEVTESRERLYDLCVPATESFNGNGFVNHNSFLAACIVLWFLACHENSIVPTVAPKEDQLLKAIWKEVGNLWPRFQKHFPQAQLLTGTIRMLPDDSAKDKWSAFAFVCGVGANEESATKAQGFHAEHMLIITEETPGIHPAIMNALFNTRTDDHNLQLSVGNPDHRQDALHQFCMSEGVRHVRISALDHPNIVTGKRVVPGTFGPKRLQQRINKLGKGSRLYESRVRGVSPSEAEEALIKWDWCVAAAKKYEDPAYREGALALGVDVANSPDGDKGAISRWQGACCTEVEAFPCPDANLLGKRVYDEAMDPNNPVDPRYIGVDEVGVGAGTVNEMRRLGMKVRKIGSGTRAVPGLDTDTLWSETAEVDGRVQPKGPAVVEAERFMRLRDQVWWRLREDLRLGRIALPYSESLFQDLTTPTYGTKNGKIVVESKEDIVKRLKRSPNEGDACAYGNWVRRRIPLRTSVPQPDMENTRNVDRGLERMLARRAKQEKAEQRQIQRALRRRRRPA